MNASTRTLWVLLPLAALAGCVISETRPEEYTPAVQATDVPESALLDVGIQVFDTGLKEGEADPKDNEYANVREAEARYIPVQLKDTLQNTGHWGMVRVVPQRSEAMDLHVSGEILESSGEKLKVRVTVVDATNREWFSRKYEGRADSAMYSDSKVLNRDPYQSLYNIIANDLAEFREQLAPEDFAEVRRVAELRFAQSLAPQSFASYLKESGGRVTTARLPAHDDPMLERVRSIREREYMFVDTLNEHYSTFFRQMEDPYENWRKFTYEELIARREVERTAMWQKLLGVAAIGAAFMIEDDYSTSVDNTARTVAVIGGVELLRAGFQTGKEAKIHATALAELGESFNSEIQPVVVEVQGETRRLQGSAETQYGEWRELLKEIYGTETGFLEAIPDVRAAADEDSVQP